MRRMGLVLALLGFISCVASLPAANWPQWRGPSANGVAPSGNYPVEWSSEKNIAWKAKLPGPGASTPIVWEDRIFLTSAIDGHNAVLAFDRDGKEVWRLKLDPERPGKHRKATGSNPSCVTDGKWVFAYFKSGQFAAVDLQGKLVWKRNLQEEFGEDTLWWDLGTSPVLTDEHVVVACMQTGPSYLAAFSKSDGQLAWKHDRNLDAPVEAAQSYSTPVVGSEGGRSVIYVLGADHVTAHDAKTGSEIWRVGGLNPGKEQYYRSIASPVISDGILIAPYARGSTLTAIKLGGQGDVTKTHVLWSLDKLGADVPTPTAANGKVYVCSDRGVVACLDIHTGKDIWRGELEKNRNNFSSSPILAGDKIYLTREDGVTFVLSAGPTFQVLAQNELDSLTVATPVLVDGRILLRTIDYLYSIGS